MSSTRHDRAARGVILLLLGASTSVAVSPARSQPPAGSAIGVSHASFLVQKKITKLQAVAGGKEGALLKHLAGDSIVSTPLAHAASALTSTQWALLKTGTRAEVIMPGRNPASGETPQARISLPLRWVKLDASGGMTVLKATIFLDPPKLVWSAADRQFRGGALVGIEDTTGTLGDGAALNPPIFMQFIGAAARPETLTFNRLGLPYQHIALAAAEPTEMRILSRLERAGIPVLLPVQSLEVPIIVSPSRIEAFGMESAVVTGSLPHGLPPDDTLTVTFTGSVRVEPSTIRIPGEHARVQSGMPGRDTLTATVDGVPAARVPIEFAWPMTFLIATLAGIVLGTLATFVWGPRRPTSTLPAVLLKCTPFALIFGFASRIGLDLFKLQLAHPEAFIATLVVSCLGAMGGRAVLERFGVAPPTNEAAPKPTDAQTPGR